jgi:hypothetical protein
VLTDEARAEDLGTAGRDAALERWAWTHQEEKTLRVIEQAAHRGTKVTT